MTVNGQSSRPAGVICLVSNRARYSPLLLLLLHTYIHTYILLLNTLSYDDTALCTFALQKRRGGWGGGGKGGSKGGGGGGRQGSLQGAIHYPSTKISTTT